MSEIGDAVLSTSPSILMTPLVALVTLVSLVTLGTFVLLVFGTFISINCAEVQYSLLYEMVQNS